MRIIPFPITQVPGVSWPRQLQTVQLDSCNVLLLLTIRIVTGTSPTRDSGLLPRFRSLALPRRLISGLRGKHLSLASFPSSSQAEHLPINGLGYQWFVKSASCSLALQLNILSCFSRGNFRGWSTQRNKICLEPIEFGFVTGGSE